jgi:3-hydroxybutyrate dehydrogenase
LSVGVPDGRIALVTGAGRGIGRAIAVALARDGARVMAVSRTEEELAALAASTPGVEYLVASVASAEGCARIVEETRRRLGPVAILVNDAGVGSSRERPIWEMTSEAWRASMATNLDGPFELTRLAAADMVRAGWGRIVMVSSTAGVLGAPSMPAYCASKHGLVGLMRAVAQDVAPHGVTCNAVLPGWVRTAMAESRAEREGRETGGDPEDFWRRVAAENPSGRIATAEEVAATVAFLAGDSASGVNGETLTVALGSAW